VARVEEAFGVGHVVDVLAGAETESIRRCGHEQLSTYGLLGDVAKKQIQSMVYQLIDQGLLNRTPGDRPILKLNDASWSVLKGQREVKLLKPKEAAPAKAKIDAESWAGVDRGLFDHLRQWRQTVARERKVPPYVVFPDSTLRNLARTRPTSETALRKVSGIGEKRLADFGSTLLEIIGQFCQAKGVDANQLAPPETVAEYVRPRTSSAAKNEAFGMFRKGWSVDDVKHKLNRARGTIYGYLADYIADEKPAKIEPWVESAVYRQVAEVAISQEERRLSPIFERLDGRVPYDIIRLVMAHLDATAD
jgi:ATP-dependent DNA helicase RecQ